MRPSTHQLVLGALCAAGQVMAVEGAQKPLPFQVGSKSENKSPLTEDYAKHVDELLEKWHVPGMAVGVVDGDDIWTEVRSTFSLYKTPEWLTRDLAVRTRLVEFSLAATHVK